MRLNRNKLVSSVISVLLASLLFLQLGCAGETVSALDYSLENKFYSSEEAQDVSTTETQDAQQQDTTTETTDTAAETTNTAAETTNTEAESTPSPEVTDPSATPDATDAAQTQDPQSGEESQPTQEPQTYLYTVLVQSESASALSGARVTIYQDGALLYSELSDSEGSASWRLPMGHAYYTRAALSGYSDSTNAGETDSLDHDMSVTITLAASEDGSGGEAQPTPLPVPEGAEGKVTITAEDITVKINESSFTLLDGVSATTENGESVSVWVVDDGGFSIDTAGEYTVTYGALQDGALKSAKRSVTVEGEAEDNSTANSTPSAPTGSSEERYEILLAYRNKVSEDLGARIQALTAEYQKKVAEAVAKNNEARILAPSTSENDTDEMTTTAQDVQQTSDAVVTNWPDVLATFLALNVSNEDHPLDVDTLLSIPLEQLDSVFWDMNQIGVYRIDGQASVLITAKTYEDMTQEYNLSAKRENFLYELMQPEFQRTFASLTGSAAFAATEQEDVDQLLESLPEEMNVDRKQVVKTALSLVGKITYVWGGKYNSLGWNHEWGASGEDDSDQVATAGLDCSGFVSWVFINAIGDKAALSAIGNGSSNQWSHSSAVGWDEGKPGDLVFYHPPGARQYNHVGIIVSVDGDGSYLVAHCSTSQKGVVVTDAWSFGFRYVRRPVFFR